MAVEKTEEKWVVAKLTPNFYKDQSYRVLLLTLLFMGVVTGCVFWLLHERATVPKPEFFASTPDGKLFDPIPMNQPNFSGPALLQWAVGAGVAAYTFNFVNLTRSLQDIRSYFTKTGYMQYVKTLTDMELLELVQTRKYVVSASPTTAPTIRDERALPEGVYAWQVRVEIVINFSSSLEETSRNLVLNMIITRVPTDEAKDGVAIASFAASEARVV